jgi:hypothetical protein
LSPQVEALMLTCSPLSAGGTFLMQFLHFFNAKPFIFSCEANCTNTALNKKLPIQLLLQLLPHLQLHRTLSTPTTHMMQKKLPRNFWMR